MRIGIVNDMPLAVEALRRALARAPEHQVVWVAGSGTEAVKLCRVDTPDLLLMDLLMPEMDGVEATRQIMASTPCAILIVTSDVDRHVSRVFEAMGHGALDVVATPVLGAAALPDAAALLRKIRNLGLLFEQNTTRKTREPIQRATNSCRQPLVAIGASAGGPAALVELLKQLPSGFPAAIVLVQHVDEAFATGMAQWLTGESHLPVRLARPGDVPQSGSVLLAGSNDHLILQRNGELAYSSEPSAHIYRPSIDVFFDSVAANWAGDSIGVLLTGMGRDGAQGLLSMRRRGFMTIAQDQASCAVYGMPKAAAQLGAASEILPLADIGRRLVALFD
ncbi:Protein-glutamate methylesterase/protein-glutamine glutaminase 3 [Pseudomonas sp. 8BK]|uniref:chemotaxis response regulator protein-glutamate methylesterase n=1 Tax=Pseudomonas sp. 8BK TaxID=2653164 RepID=UPI0012F09D78|nr:chemotaxis response regulator protein-glutamate methylesterase [Pseudomonas sp. 8BK]VXC36418.1 Protein-glutamate methylesterase/protein-glutamine glutaminase 3 [Pseudomonas sp. 8BK]